MLTFFWINLSFIPFFFENVSMYISNNSWKNNSIFESDIFESILLFNILSIS